MPQAWSEHVRRWFALTEDLREAGAPDDAERYMLFQNLVGAWPIDSHAASRPTWRRRCARRR